MDEPGTFSDNNTQTQSASKSAKDNLATVITIGIIVGFLIIVFAVTWIIIDIIPIPDKWEWLLTDATIGNWILLVFVDPCLSQDGCINEKSCLPLRIR